MELLIELLADQERVLGKHQPQTLETKELLASHFMRNGRVQEGQEHYEEVLTAHESSDLSHADGDIPRRVHKQSLGKSVNRKLRYAMLLHEVGQMEKAGECRTRERVVTAACNRPPQSLSSIL